MRFEERPCQSRVKERLKGMSMQPKNDAYLQTLDNRIAATHRYGELRGKPGEAEAYDDMRRADREFEEIATRT